MKAGICWCIKLLAGVQVLSFMERRRSETAEKLRQERQAQRAPVQRRLSARQLKAAEDRQQVQTPSQCRMRPFASVHHLAVMLTCRWITSAAPACKSSSDWC